MGSIMVWLKVIPLSVVLCNIKNCLLTVTLQWLCVSFPSFGFGITQSRSVFVNLGSVEPPGSLKILFGSAKYLKVRAGEVKIGKARCYLTNMRLRQLCSGRLGFSDHKKVKKHWSRHTRFTQLFPLKVLRSIQIISWLKFNVWNYFKVFINWVPIFGLII